MTVRLEDLPLRDDLRGQKPYGAPQEPLAVALNVNENTHPVPADVADDIAESVAKSISGLNRYPDREFVELREAFAEYLGHGIEADQVWAANGSNEVLQHVLQAFGGPGRTAMGFAPTYSMYPLLVRGVGSNGSPARAARASSSIPRMRRVRCAKPIRTSSSSARPITPRAALSLDVVEAVYEASRGIVIVDEAYFEFSPDDGASALTLLPGRERLVVSRTMSKAFAFAGARVGYLAADAAVVDALRLVRLPYHLSAITQAAATAALRHSDEMLRTVDEIVVQRDRISATLEALGYDPYPSGSNFVLFGGVDDPHDTWRRLYERGVLVRDVGIPGHLRVSAGTEDETSAFLDALARIGDE